MNYIDEIEMKEYEVHLYPGIGSNGFIFYDDKGYISMDAGREQIHILITDHKHDYRLILHNVKAEKVLIGDTQVNFDVNEDDTMIRVNSRECTGNISIGICHKQTGKAGIVLG